MAKLPPSKTGSGTGRSKVLMPLADLGLKPTPTPYAHQLRAYCDLLDSMATAAQELAVGADNPSTRYVLGRLCHNMQEQARILRHQALSVVGVADNGPEAA